MRWLCGSHNSSSHELPALVLLLFQSSHDATGKSFKRKMDSAFLHTVLWTVILWSPKYFWPKFFSQRNKKIVFQVGIELLAWAPRSKTKIDFLQPTRRHIKSILSIDICRLILFLFLKRIQWLFDLVEDNKGLCIWVNNDSDDT